MEEPYRKVTGLACIAGGGVVAEVCSGCLLVGLRVCARMLRRWLTMMRWIDAWQLGFVTDAWDCWDSTCDVDVTLLGVVSRARKRDG